MGETLRISRGGRHLARYGEWIARHDAKASERMIALVDAWGDEYG